MAKFQLDTKQVEQLEQKIGKLKEVGENIINETLSTFGTRTSIKDITELVPTSSRNKKHAKDSNPFKSTPFNLGFLISSKKAFSYLVFPNEGIGKRNKNAQKFMEGGISDSTPKIIDQLNNVLNKRIEEEL